MVSKDMTHRTRAARIMPFVTTQHRVEVQRSRNQKSQVQSRPWILGLTHQSHGPAQEQQLSRREKLQIGPDASAEKVGGFGARTNDELLRVFPSSPPESLRSLLQELKILPTRWREEEAMPGAFPTDCHRHVTIPERTVEGILEGLSAHAADRLLTCSEDPAKGWEAFAASGVPNAPLRGQLEGYPLPFLAQNSSVHKQEGATPAEPFPPI
jgi:hypothetical protein